MKEIFSDINIVGAGLIGAFVAYSLSQTGYSITVVEKKPNEKIMFGEGWHTDSTYTPQPPKFTMLYSIKTPEKGKGNTRFASQYLSYESLDQN